MGKKKASKATDYNFDNIVAPATAVGAGAIGIIRLSGADVITIAQDPEGAVTIFLAKNSPESVTCFALHQNGSKLEKIDFDQWYRYVDIL